MIKVFITQPMRGLSDEDILNVRKDIIDNIQIILNGEEFDVIDSFFDSYPGYINKHIPIWYLSKSIELMSEADIAYFAKGWSEYRGCRIEYQVAKEYGICIIEE